MSTSVVTSQGQITIPKAVRQALGLDVGARVVFVLEDGRVLLYPVKREPIERLRGSIHTNVPFTTTEAGRQAAREAVVSHLKKSPEG